MGAAPFVAGVDGCPGGWVALFRRLDGGEARARRVERLAEVADAPEAPQVIAVDMPIGLPERAGPLGRAPERLVRPLLGARQSSVFSVPSRPAVYASLEAAVPEAERFRHVCAVARATSSGGKAVAKQCFHIFPKIIEVDGLLGARPELRARIHECHPEVSFWALNGRMPLALPKKIKGQPNDAGLDERRALLAAAGFEAELLAREAARRLKVGPDDLLDAAAAAWSAARIARGEADRFPDPPERDGLGLPIAISV